MKLFPVLRTVIAMMMLTLLPAATGFQKPERAELPNLDERQADAHPLPLPTVRENALAKLRERVPGLKVNFDPVLQTPTSISSRDGFLSGPNGEGRGISTLAARAVAADDPHRAIKAFLNDHAALFGHGAELLSATRVKREFVNAHNQLRTVVWEQQLDGVPAFEATLIGHITKKGELVSLSSRLLPNVAAAADAGLPGRARLQKIPSISAEQAVALAVQNLGQDQAVAGVASVEAAAQGAEKQRHFTAAAVRGEADVQLVWLPMHRAALRLCWQIIFVSQARGEMFRVLVDTETGRVLVRHGLTNYISNASYRVYPSDSPSPFSPGHATPSSAQPALVSRVLIVTNAFNTNASPNGWIHDGSNETRGNNVDAHLDRDGNNLADLPRPQGSPFRVFDFPLDLAQSPTTYGNAAVVQLFYLNNWIHDKFYELGFTEAAGNFQDNNFGRGGFGNDAVQADAQDGEGFNNANFNSPPDGSAPRMQMYVFNGPNPDRDGDLDAEIVIHEYTHGLSNRRVGGGVGLTQLQSAGMGEGWSDFYALSLLSSASDDVNGNYALGSYATYGFFGLAENYYYGIRRYPYSTDLTKNPLTFRDIDPAQASSHGGIPRSSVAGGGGANEVHNQGEVWCVALWEARANLIAKHGWAIGNQLMLQLVTDGMNLSPANPNFLEARDGIIQADQVLTGGANHHELWAGFAKRGLGFNAFSPASSTTAGLVENFDLPDDLLITPSSDIISSGPIGGPFSGTSNIFTLANVGSTSLTWSAVSTKWILFSAQSGTLAPGGTAATVTVSLDPVVASLPKGSYSASLYFTNQASGIVQQRTVSLRIEPPDYFTEVFDAGDVDIGFQTLTFTPDGSANFYSVCRASATNFLMNPTGGAVLILTDDGYQPITLPGGAQVPFFQNHYGTIYVGANGYLTFTAGDTQYAESVKAHFNRPRISAFFRDLNPAAGGTISWKQTVDRLAVTYENVPEYATSLLNNFQIEMFFDGTIRLTHLGLGSTFGLTGLSGRTAGSSSPPDGNVLGAGLPLDFGESNLSAYESCLPALKVFVPASVNESAGVLTNGGVVQIPQPLANDLTVQLTSSNPAQATVPASLVILAGHTNAVFEMTLLDDAWLNGSRFLRISASATNYRSASSTFAVQDNEAAALSVILPTSAREGDGLLAGQGTVSVSAPPDKSVVVYLFSTDTNELTVPPPALAIIPAGQTSTTFDLMVVDDKRVDGARTAAILAHVENWTDGLGAMTVFDNESTNLSIRLPALVSEGNGVLTNVGQVSVVGPLVSNLVVTLTSSDTTEIIVPVSVLILAGQTSAVFNVTVVDDSLLDGPQVVTVTASAPRFLSGGAVLTVADNDMPVAPFNPRPLHLSGNNPTTTSLAWRSGEGEQIVNGNFETGDFTGWSAENTGSGDFVLNDGTFDPESADDPLPPYAGNFSALSQQGAAGKRVLYQDFFIPSNATFAALQWADRIRNHASSYSSHQQFHVEVRNVLNQLLGTVFSTMPGDALLNGWATRTADLSSFRGQNIRLAFVEEDSAGYLNVHLDNVSVILGAAAPTSFDVYFGTNAALVATNLLGSTTNIFWELPALAQQTTYYWQVIAKRGSVTTPGPIWQFTTRKLLALTTLVSTGSVWKFLADGSNQGTNWIQPGFDDSGWSNGLAKLGFGNDGEATVIGYQTNGFTTFYFRKAFNVSDASAISNLTARLVRDDGAIIYLNGQEAYRSNMPLGPVDYLTQASSVMISPAELGFFTNTINTGLLSNGVNVLAIELHQRHNTSFSPDLGFEFELTALIASASNALPLVGLTSPANYSVFTLPTNVLISANAAVSNGFVSKVEFFDGAMLIGQFNAAPYSFIWTNPVPGNHVITAVATDNHGASNVSSAVHTIIRRGGGAAALTLVPAGARWSYLDDGSNQNAVWRSNNFDDYSWAAGAAKLGYGNGDEATVIGFGPNPTNKFITTYFRHTFTNVAAISNLTLNLLGEDGAVAYLNEVEIFRCNMPVGAIDYLTKALNPVAGATEAITYTTNLNPALLLQGKNVLAIEVHQFNGSSADLGFDLQLNSIGNVPPSVVLTRPTNNASFLESEQIPVTASATDVYGSISKLEFFNGDLKFGEMASGPFNTTLTNLLPGTYFLKAAATDNGGLTSESETVSITIFPTIPVSLARVGSSLKISWPSASPGFVLETTPSLAQPILWTAVTNQPVEADGKYSVTVDAVTGSQFFRLAKP